MSKINKINNIAEELGKIKEQNRILGELINLLDEEEHEYTRELLMDLVDYILSND